MAATITFDQVFTKEGAKNGRAWKRWDFKFGDDRYSTFEQEVADAIVVGQPATIEFETKTANGFTNRTITAVLTPQGVEATQESSSSPEAVRTAPVSAQGDGPDWDRIGRGKTRCNLVSSLLPALFSALPEDQQSSTNAETLLDWAFNYVYSE